MQSKIYDPAVLQNLLKLAKKREGIMKALQQVESEISELVHSKEHSCDRLPLPLGRTMGRGMLKQEILASLTQAGEKGMSVRELSAKLGMRSQNIHVWFSSTGKKVAGLQKIGEGRYRYQPKAAALPQLPMEISQEDWHNFSVSQKGVKVLS
ncbi:MAG: hypothetical protein C5B47_06070 [Verrucomicrobia bacterium]|nr:MAG: hypothetical protein C5B47_06070 [Verrucomicrobiota bacterium]